MNQTNDQSNKRFDHAMDDLSRALDAELRPLRSPPPPRPAVPVGGAGVAMWGPSNPPATAPLQLLLEVANNAHKLQADLLALNEAVTGEVAPIRSRSPAKLPVALLPAVAHLAHEIGEVHAVVLQTIGDLRARL